MSGYGSGPHQQAILRLLRDGRGRTARQIATRLDQPVTATSGRLKNMADRWPPLLHPHPAKPPRRGRIWRLTPLGRDYLTRLDTE